MHSVFCTLFDKNYLYKGLALHRSLKVHCREFTLWILCMDQLTYDTLGQMNLECARLIPLADFEDDVLRRIRQERTAAEYCWTCTAPLILYVLQQEPQAPHVAYLDADLFFYRDPEPLYDELGEGSILIIPHRYAPAYQDRESTSGIYNVSMVIFRRDPVAEECLQWWKAQCLLACTLDPEAGQCGDQKYLDDWPSRFRNVVVLRHKGGGMAPWNISNYRLSHDNGRVRVDEDELIFYHFHSFQIVRSRLPGVRLFLASRGYHFTGAQIALIYRPYIQQLCRAMRQVGEISPGFDWGRIILGWREMARLFRVGDLLLA